jgi:transposase
MHVVHPICCGLDGHQARLTAGLRRVDADGQVTTALREFGPLYSELRARSDWLRAQHCPVVAMESTGVYWQPISHVLVGVVEVRVGNAREMRPRPGHKTDPAEARWRAERCAPGLSRPRFVPPPATRALRDLTRTRVGLVQTRTQAKQRVQQVLEDSNSKRASVVSDVCGTRGPQLLTALLEGEREAQTVASMALGRLRRKRSERALAFTGQCTEPHGRLIALSLERIDLLERQRAERNEPRRLLIEPFMPQREQLDSSPGVDVPAARDILGEMGMDMSRFGSAARLASWAKGSPGNNARAGTRRRSRTGNGNRYLRRMLVPWAWSARNPPTCLGRPLRRREARVGGKRAAVAVGHTMLVIVSPLRWQGPYYEEQRYADQRPKREDRARKRAIPALERLGYRVTVDRVASPLGVHPQL